MIDEVSQENTSAILWLLLLLLLPKHMVAISTKTTGFHKKNKAGSSCSLCTRDSAKVDVEGAKFIAETRHPALWCHALIDSMSSKWKDAEGLYVNPHCYLKWYMLRGSPWSHSWGMETSRRGQKAQFSENNQTLNLLNGLLLHSGMV